MNHFERPKHRAQQPSKWVCADADAVARTLSRLVIGALVPAALAWGCSGAGSQTDDGSGQEVLTAMSASSTDPGTGDGSDLGAMARAGSETAPLSYDDGSLWACRPDRDDDLCLTSDLTRTDVRADGSFVSVEHEALAEPEFDCFYLYPDVNYDSSPKNTTDLTSLSNLEDINARVVAQSAWFRSVCNVYAPLYRQMTVGSYEEEFPEGEFFESGEPFALAYGDVRAAFDHYMSHDNQGRSFVLIGHSQGTHMLTRLLLDRFDGEPETRQQLISALLIGPLGRVFVPEGQVLGGTFENLPLCEAEDQTGCVIAFDSVAAGVEFEHTGADAIPEGMVRACTNPAALGGGTGTLGSATWYTAEVPLAPEEVDEPWLSYADYYTTECASNGDLEISPIEDDPRRPVGDPAHVQEVIVEESGDEGAGLHFVDFNLGWGDLLRIVEKQGAAH